jgi:predicted nucleic acid-binding protein
MSHYADSSFLVSCHVTDANTSQAKAFLARLNAPLSFTALHALEVRNALRLGVFRGLFAESDAVAARANLESDLRSGRLVRMKVN